jgi:hypothetical protein
MDRAAGTDIGSFGGPLLLNPDPASSSRCKGESRGGVMRGLPPSGREEPRLNQTLRNEP